MGKVNVVVDKKRVDGSRVRLAEVEVGDETGTVSLRARDEQIDVIEDVSKRNGAVVLRNCMLELYQGKHIRLAVTKWGKLSTYPDQVASTPPPPSKINYERNFSLIDLSLVASESAVQPFPTVPSGSGGGSGSGSGTGGSPEQPQQQQQQNPSMQHLGPSTGQTGSGGTFRQQRPQQSTRQNPMMYPPPNVQQQGRRGSGRGGGPGGIPGGHKQRGGRGGAQKLQQQQQRHMQQKPPQTTLHSGIHYAPQDPMGTARYGVHNVNVNVGGGTGVGWHQHAQHEHATETLQPYYGIPVANAADPAQQQMLLRQQYELQQQQLQQMYQQQQQHHHHQQQQQQQQDLQRSTASAPSSMGHLSQQQQQHHHYLTKQGSFDQALPIQQHGAPPVGMGSSPLMMSMPPPMSPPPSLSFQQQQQQQQQGAAQSGSPDGGQQMQYHTMQQGVGETPVSPNKMNPQAATFAPNYNAAGQCTSVLLSLFAVLFVLVCFTSRK